MAKIGRPPKPAGEGLEEVMRFRVRPSDRERIERIAAGMRMSVTEYLRSVALRDCGGTEDDRGAP